MLVEVPILFIVLELCGGKVVFSWCRFSRGEHNFFSKREYKETKHFKGRGAVFTFLIINVINVL